MSNNNVTLIRIWENLQTWNFSVEHCLPRFMGVLKYAGPVWLVYTVLFWIAFGVGVIQALAMAILIDLFVSRSAIAYGVQKQEEICQCR